MRDLKPLLLIAGAILLGHYFEDEIKQFQHYNILLPVLFSLGLVSIIYRKIKVLKYKTFVRAKFDDLKQVLRILLGIIIITFAMNYWISNSFFFWLLLFAGIGSIISNIFYESTIQLYIKEDKLFIQYSNSTYYSFTKIDSFDLEKGILKIYFDRTRIEVYNVKMSDSNIGKLLSFLQEFQRKKNANKR